MDWSARSWRAVAGIAAIVGSCLAAFPLARAWAADCVVAVVVEGDEPARTRIAEALARTGARLTPDPGCGFETVQVRAAGSAFALTITDPYGRVTRRTVADLEAARALVESTPGSDALLPLLPEAEAPPAAPGLHLGDVLAADVPSPPSEPAGRPAAAAVVSDARPAEVPPGHGLSLSVATELAAGSDSSGWAGLAISGCVALGPLCVGTRVRFWHDLDVEDESGDVIHQRDTGEIALSLDVPFTRRRIAVRPGVELGLGWVHMGQFAVRPTTDDDTDFDQGEVLTGAHVTASTPLSKRWALEVGLGATLSLFAHQGSFTVQGARLPGEPLAFGIASLGVRYGAP